MFLFFLAWIFGLDCIFEDCTLFGITDYGLNPPTAGLLYAVIAERFTPHGNVNIRRNARWLLRLTALRYLKNTKLKEDLKDGSEQLITRGRTPVFS